MQHCVWWWFEWRGWESGWEGRGSVYIRYLSYACGLCGEDQQRQPQETWRRDCGWLNYNIRWPHTVTESNEAQHVYIHMWWTNEEASWVTPLYQLWVHRVQVVISSLPVHLCAHGLQGGCLPLQGTENQEGEYLDLTRCHDYLYMEMGQSRQMQCLRLTVGGACMVWPCILHPDQVFPPILLSHYVSTQYLYTLVNT